MYLESFGFHESANLIGKLHKMLDTNIHITKQDALEYIFKGKRTKIIKRNRMR